MFPSDHPLFDPSLIEHIITYCDGLGYHIDRPIDLTQEQFSYDTRHTQSSKLPVCMRIQTHVQEEQSICYLVLWSNGDRSWEYTPPQMDSRLGRCIRLYWRMKGHVIRADNHRNDKTTIWLDYSYSSNV